MTPRSRTDLLVEPLERALAAGLPEFLPKQRWFGGKSRAIERVALDDLAWLPGEGAPSAVAIVSVLGAGGSRECYTLVLALLESATGLPSIGVVEVEGAPLTVVEAATRPDVARRFLLGLTRPGEIATLRGGRLAYGDVRPDDPGALLEEHLRAEMLRPLGVDQSNTSLRIGTTHLFKLLRRKEAGENPELEIGRFLARHGTFRATPALRGSVVHVAASGEASTIGVLQQWVDSRGDGWTHVRDAVRRVLRGDASPEPLSESMLVLGAVTGDLHRALASGSGDPAFDAEPVTATDVVAWRASLASRAGAVVEILRARRAALPAEARDLADSILRSADRLGAGPDLPPPKGGGAFQRIRVHGDYHLGQTLRTAEGFILFDFEGEPARPLEERRRKHCAAKDVAGMLRSLDYVVEAARRDDPKATGDAPPLRDAYLEGYRSRTTGASAPFVPADPEARDAWTRFFELDKALYEIEYEANHRPDWIVIPLRGVRRILAPGRSA